MVHRHARVALLGSAAVACLMAGMLVGVLAAGGSVAKVFAVRTRTVSTAVTHVQPTTVTATAVRSVTVTRRAPPPGHAGHRHRRRGHHGG